MKNTKPEPRKSTALPLREPAKPFGTRRSWPLGGKSRSSAYFVCTAVRGVPQTNCFVTGS